MDTKIKSFVLRGLALLLVAVGVAAFLHYGLPVLLPFLISYVISAGIRPLSELFAKKTRIPKKVWAIVFIVISVGVVTAVFWFLGSTLAQELQEALKTVGEMLSDGESPVRQTSEKMMGMLREVNMISEEYSIDIGKIVSTAFSSLTESIASFVGSLVSGAPSFLFFVVVMLLSLFWFSCDGEGIKKELARFLPEKAMSSMTEWSRIGLRALARFARVYLSLLCITFAVLSVGFLLIGVEYPLLAALLSALVDLLPVFGVGTVLVPWSVVLFVTGETAKGIWMLVLFCVMYALRQILEPKLVGDAMGVHPVLALFAVFLGFRLGGVGGMIIAPVLINGLFVFLDEKKKKV